MATVEFTYEWYDEFLARLTTEQARFRSYDQSLDDGDVLLRHDVDLSPGRALSLGRIEADRDVQATYFLLVTSPLYNPLDQDTRAVVEELDELGHDIGLHFSTHQYWDAADPPTEETLRQHIEAEREVLSSLPVDPIDTVSFHLPPEWVLDSRIEGVDSAYEPRFFDEIAYCADSNQRWREEPPLADGQPAKVQILTHPGLWGVDDASFERRVREATDETEARVDDYARSRYVPEPVVEG